MTERDWSIPEVLESLRTWEADMYSESETKWLMNKAADIIRFYIDTLHYIDEQRKRDKCLDLPPVE